MLRDEILALLRSAGGAYRSGGEMSAALGVSRAAVWKVVEALRQEGYQISSAPNRGYRLDEVPDHLNAADLQALLPDTCSLGRHLFCLDSVDSTNNECKRMAANGAPEGTIVIANQQTGGRGRNGRRFLSPAGAGLYLSVLLRPSLLPAEAVNLTAWTAVAVCSAIERACPALHPAIKWPNDVLLDGKKLCGILTEMGIEGETGRLEYVVIGIGINLRSTMLQIDASLSDKATSLEAALGTPPRRDVLTASLIQSLDALLQDFPSKGSVYWPAYQARCVTLHRPVSVLRPGAAPRVGTAVDIDPQFRLLVDFGSGPEPVESGEVSVRGLLGYL